MTELPNARQQQATSLGSLGPAAGESDRARVRTRILGPDFAAWDRPVVFSSVV